MTNGATVIRTVLAMATGSLCLAWSLAGWSAALDAGTMWKIKRLGPPALSPDGGKAVVPVTAYDPETDEGRTELWLIPSEGREASALTTGGVSGGPPAWSPDGNYLAFTARRENDESDQIYVMPAAGGEARRLTSIPGDATAPRWFPDSHRIAFITRVWPGAEDWEEQASLLVYFPNQSHWILTARDSIFWYRQKKAWLDEFIGHRPTRIVDRPTAN